MRSTEFMVTKMSLEIDAHFVRLHWLELFHYLGNLVVLPVPKYNLIWCRTIDYRKGHRVPARCPTTKSTSKNSAYGELAKTVKSISRRNIFRHGETAYNGHGIVLYSLSVLMKWLTSCTPSQFSYFSGFWAPCFTAFTIAAFLSRGSHARLLHAHSLDGFLHRTWLRV